MTKKPLKGAIIGFGFISSKGHWPAYKAMPGEVEIVAVADACEARRQIASEMLPHAAIYTDASILIEGEARNIDFVDISTPPAFHAEIAELALKNGLHVLCEKPLATDANDAVRMLEAAREYRRVLFPCHNYKHAPVVKAIQSVLDSGKLGAVKSLTLNTYRNTHAKGVTEWKTNWRREKRFGGGGIAMDHGSHTFYLTFDWLKSYPTHVTAKMTNLDPKYDTEDNFSAVLTFPKGLAHVHLTWTAGVRKVIYTVQCDKGAITVDDDEIQIACQRATSGPDVAQGAITWDVEKKSIASNWMDASHVQWFQSLFAEFRRAIDEEQFVGKELKESYLCVEIIQTAYQSAAESCKELKITPKVPIT